MGGRRSEKRRKSTGLVENRGGQFPGVGNATLATPPSSPLSAIASPSVRSLTPEAQPITHPVFLLPSLR